jgi:hypothetical protein
MKVIVTLTYNKRINLTYKFTHIRVCTVSVRGAARFKNKLMGFMVYFSPAKINTNQYYESVSLNAGIIAQ